MTAPSSSASEAVDIVQRLQQTRTPGAEMLCIAASSEIERLRALVSSSEAERYRSCAELLARAEAAEARAASAEAERDEALNCPPGYVEATNAIIEGLTAQRDALAAKLAVMDAALGEIAKQKTVNELCAEFGKDYETDWEGGYDQCIRRAREARTCPHGESDG